MHKAPNAKCQRVLVLALLLVIIIRPHHSTTFIEVAYCYQLSSVVCQSVALVSHAKTFAPIEMPFGLSIWVGPGNHLLDGGPDPPWEGAILRVMIEVLRDVAMATNFGTKIAITGFV